MTLVSTSAFYDRSTRDLSSLRTRAEGLQTALSTGQRLLKPSDDPVGAAQLRSLMRGLERFCATQPGGIGPIQPEPPRQRRTRRIGQAPREEFGVGQAHTCAHGISPEAHGRGRARVAGGQIQPPPLALQPG